MAITKNEVEHIAGLARIKLSETEKEKMSEDLGQILDYINKLKEINTDGIEATAQITGLENVFRSDETRNNDDVKNEIAAKILKSAPHRDNGYIKVKQVFENTD